MTTDRAGVAWFARLLRYDAWANAETLASLLGNTQLNATVLGFSLLLNKTGVLNALDALLTTVVAPIDAVVSDILDAAGVSIGELDVVVGGLRCDGAALVH